MLRTDEFSRNEATFDELHSVVRRGITIPFVGAGMSVDAGCPGWTSYLLKCCDEARLDVNKAKVRLDNGEYESVIQDVIERLTTNRFELNFAQDFNHGDLYDSAVTRLPAIFGGCAITTNFDRVLEDAYSSSGRGFTEKVVGTHETGTFLKAIPRGERYLLKLHGNIDNPRHRVLTADEYDAAYGPRENINFRRELPKTLSRIFSGYTLVFLGCSLTHDRTLQTFESIVAREGVNRLPSHYAIVECPEDDDGDEMNARLARSNIKPIWYPFGEHEAVSEIIQLLQSETS